jgi:flagellar basal-body rod modification protein FlgD
MSTVSSVLPTTSASATTTTPDDSLGPNAFLQLLTTELQNQDPDNPQDATESVTQLAQMSELQYQQQLTSAFQAFQSNFGVLQAASLIGKAATVNTGTSSSSSASSTVTGIIQSIDVQDGTPYFTMTNASGQTITDTNGDPLLFSTSQIVGIGSASSVTGTSSSSSGT